jgi:flagellar biosynthesis protein FliQ
MSALLELATREGFGLALALLVPLLVVACGATLLSAMLALALRIRDPLLAHCVRVAALLAALGVLVEGMALATHEFARARWSSLAHLHTAPATEAE